ncbi:MAG: cytochrome c biogenesis protein ResB [Planctomycetes bacterium]|jgi:hypothetical protein|nr:cytochrome c biogenesis protein ResB [Planctomycetota bacterium]
MGRFRRSVLWAALLAILLLTGLSIYSAFLGPERAQAFFNSLPLAVYWFALIALLAVGIVVFRRLLRVPALLLMHLGSILVVLGAMWGSNSGHALAKRLLGIDKIPEGQMAILEGTQENRVFVTDSNSTRELPFFVRLRDFRMEYYQPGQLSVRSETGQSGRVPAEAGQTVSLDEGRVAVTIRRVFQNFRMDLQGDERVAYDLPGGSNPALEVAIEKPGEPPARRYVFERAPGHENPNDSVRLSYFRAVRDYISELEIVQNGKVVAAKHIEVNHPLHYGGYHLYQHSYGQDKLGEYTVLMVVSDSGLNLVHSGYAMLLAGVFWHFWGRRILVALQGRRTTAGEVAG